MDKKQRGSAAHGPELNPRWKMIPTNAPVSGKGAGTIDRVTHLTDDRMCYSTQTWPYITFRRVNSLLLYPAPFVV